MVRRVARVSARRMHGVSLIASHAVAQWVAVCGIAESVDFLFARLLRCVTRVCFAWMARVAVRLGYNVQLLVVRGVDAMGIAAYAGGTLRVRVSQAWSVVHRFACCCALRGVVYSVWQPRNLHNGFDKGVEDYEEYEGRDSPQAPPAFEGAY
jgi:hypothetical protein